MRGSKVQGRFKIGFETLSMDEGMVDELRDPVGTIVNSGTAGYFVAGYSTSDSGSSSIDKIAFSNDTRSVLSETLPSGMNELQQTAGFANSGTL